MKWIDVSVPLRASTVVWPGDPAVEVERVCDLARGDEATVTRLGLSAHAGTHVDAPSHYLAGGASLDAMPLEAGIGPARVVALDGEGEVPASAVRGLRRGERILFRTTSSDRRLLASPVYASEHTCLSPEAARALAALPLRLVGIDYLSIGGADAHRVLLAAGIWVVEGLDLADVAPGRYDLVCLPLRIAGAEAAPARVALRKRR